MDGIAFFGNGEKGFFGKVVFLLKKAFLIGVTASFFFAFTFVLNRSMNLAGSSPLWSAALRYLLLTPILLVVLLPGGRYRTVLRQIASAPGPWLLWSTVGFGLFYLPLTLASSFGASWFVAACWELTIPAGILLTPLFGRPIPLRTLLCSLVVVAGVFVLQLQSGGAGDSLFVCIALLLIAAFSYPLGNRKMMARCGGSLSALERVFGMSLCSLPFWLVVAAAGALTSGAPAPAQLFQSLLVAVFSGIIATALFFKATDLVRENPAQLAAVEATQAGEVLFTLLGGVVLLGDNVPSLSGWIGIALVAGGIVLSSLCAAGEKG